MDGNLDFLIFERLFFVPQFLAPTGTEFPILTKVISCKALSPVQS